MEAMRQYARGLWNTTVVEHHGEGGGAVAADVLAASGEAHRERHAGAFSYAAQRGFYQGSHGAGFYSALDCGVNLC
jgi:hypothetical protein